MMPKRIKFHASFLYDQLISPLQPLPNIMFEDCINYFTFQRLSVCEKLKFISCVSLPLSMFRGLKT